MLGYVADVLLITVTSAVLAAVAWSASLLWARRHFTPDRRAARALAIPAVIVAGAAAGLCALGWAEASPALWGIAAILGAGATAFSGGADWHRFERDFWSHVARHQEFHVRSRD